MSVHHFDVMKAMVDEDSKDILLAPLDNVSQLRKVKAGTQVTIGVPGDMVAAIARGEYVGGLVLCRAEAFMAVRDRLLSDAGLDPEHGYHARKARPRSVEEER